MGRGRTVISDTVDIICIGAHKAGTTWLHRMLLDHPAVHAPAFKEIHYFDSLHLPGLARFQDDRAREAVHRLRTRIRQNRLHSLGVDFVIKVLRHRRLRRFVAEQELAASLAGQLLDDDWYRALFADARPGQVRIDFTTAYALLNAEGIQHMRALCGGAQVLYLLRHPVDRAISHARMRVTRKGWPPTDDSVRHFLDEHWSYRHGDYVGNIARWQALWPAAQFHLLSYEDIATRPLELLARVCDIAGIDFKPRYFRHHGETVFRGPPIPVSPETRRMVEERCRPMIEAMKHDFPEVAGHWRLD
ncbi:MAG: sulfotransferase [Zavarzinia sp.]|nr:sulfotransferase [Zavarzinia sp.]